MELRPGTEVSLPGQPQLYGTVLKVGLFFAQIDWENLLTGEHRVRLTAKYRLVESDWVTVTDEDGIQTLRYRW